MRVLSSRFSRVSGSRAARHKHPERVHTLHTLSYLAAMASNLRIGPSHSKQQPHGPLPTDSMTHLLLGPLDNLNSVAQQIFQSLSPPHTKPPPPPAIAALANADADLAEAIQLAHIHQKKQQRIEALKAEVLSLEASWRTVIMQLEEGRRDLEAIILEGDVHLDAIEQAKAGTTTHGLFCQGSQLLTGRCQVLYLIQSSLHMRRV